MQNKKKSTKVGSNQKRRKTQKQNLQYISGKRKKSTIKRKNKPKKMRPTKIGVSKNRKISRSKRK